MVAADDGVMPRTREHIAILDLLGIRRGLVALSKADLADADRLASAVVEIRAALAGTALADAPILPVSAWTGQGLAALEAALARAEAETAAPQDSGAFRFSVDRSFTSAGAGTVVTGTVLSGAVSVGDQVVVSPRGLLARVRSIHAQNRPARRGLAGRRCGLNLAGEGVSKDAIARGDMALDPALHAPTDRIDAGFRVLAGEPKPLGAWFPARLHHASAEVGVRFVLRDVSAQRTIGGGRFLDLRAPARERRTPERLAQLEALSGPDPARAFARLLEMPPFQLEVTAFARDHALTEAEGRALVENAGAVAIEAGGLRHALSQGRWSAFERSLAAETGRFHEENPAIQGIGRERLRLLVQPRPPRVRDTADLFEVAETEVRRVLKACSRLGRVDRIAHDHFFARRTTAEMVEIALDVASRAEGGAFTAAACRNRMDNGRKVAIQILDFFDRHGVTLRRGDLRPINHRSPSDGPVQSDRARWTRGVPGGASGLQIRLGSETVPDGLDSHSLPPSRNAP